LPVAALHVDAKKVSRKKKSRHPHCGMAFLLQQRTTTSRTKRARLRGLVHQPDSQSLSAAAFELHLSRHKAPHRRQRKLFTFNSLGDPGNRSDEAKLTACRKVRRMYRRTGAKSSYKARK
jgi:hypothetical protein